MYQAFTAGSISTTGQTICSGTTINQIGSQVNASGGDNSITYLWREEPSTTLTTGNNELSYTPVSVVGTRTFTRWAKDNTCNTAYSKSDGQWVLTVNALPTTTSLTPTPATICAGESSTLAAVASNAASYSFDNGSSWQAAATKVVTPGTTAGYTLKVKSAAGCVSSDSKAATVTVYAYPSITAQPAGTAVCSGTAATLTVSASNANIWQWRKNGNNVTDGSGSSTNSYTTAALSANATYSVVVSNGLAACSATSNNALVTVYAIPVINTHPAATTICANKTASLSVVASNATAWQWRKRSINVTDGTG
jgi:hypothetical protein